MHATMAMWVIGVMLFMLSVMLVAAIGATFGEPHYRSHRLWWLAGLMAPEVLLILICLNHLQGIS
jgi:hypothetical protein